MKTIYQDVAARLLERIPKIKYIDIDKGQLEVGFSESKRPPVRYPCVLISIDITSARDITDTLQECQAAITLRVAQEVMAGVDATAMHAIQERQLTGLEPYELVAEIYAALQGYHSLHFLPLSRRSQRKEQNSKLFVYRIEYTTTFDDITALDEIDPQHEDSGLIR